MEKLWPSIVRINYKNKLSIKTIITELTTKIEEEFYTRNIYEDTSDASMLAAVALWRQVEVNNTYEHDERKRLNIQSYNNLLEKLNSLLNDDALLVFSLHSIRAS